MKILSVKAKDVNFNDKVINLARKNGFHVSNPDQHTGRLIDLIIRENSRLVGFDILAVDSIYNAYQIVSTDDTKLIEDWIKDHETTT